MANESVVSKSRPQPARVSEPRKLDETASPSIVGEFWQFLKVRKKFWLLPIVLMLVLIVGLVILAEGSAVAPFIYTLF